MKAVGYDNYNIVFSRIHDDKTGKLKAEELWEQMRLELFGETSVIAQPLKVYYSADLAVADYFPLESARQIFSPLASMVEEEIIRV